MLNFAILKIIIFCQILRRSVYTTMSLLINYYDRRKLKVMTINFVLKFMKTTANWFMACCQAKIK